MEKTDRDAENEQKKLQERKGRNFDVIIESSGHCQATYHHFFWCDDGSLQIPNWDDHDERWTDEGIIFLDCGAVAMSKKEYDSMSSHFEDDWLSWDEVLCAEICNEKDLDLQFS